jgi:hypothetical protein
MNRYVGHETVAGPSARLFPRKITLAFLALGALMLMSLGVGIHVFGHPKAHLWLPLVCALPLPLERLFVPLIEWWQQRQGLTPSGPHVRALLDNLSADHLVFHDVAGGSGNIDHVVIRNDGAVMLIDVRADAGKVWEEDGALLVNGAFAEKDFIKQTRLNATWLQDTLAFVLGAPATVNAAVAFPNAWVSLSEELNHVRVMNSKSLMTWMSEAWPNRKVSERLRLIPRAEIRQGLGK